MAPDLGDRLDPPLGFERSLVGLENGKRGSVSWHGAFNMDISSDVKSGHIHVMFDHEVLTNQPKS